MVFTARSAFIRHLDRHLSINDDVFNCHICGSPKQNMVRFVRHCLGSHSHYSIECVVCFNMFGSKLELDLHICDDTQNGAPRMSRSEWDEVQSHLEDDLLNFE